MPVIPIHLGPLAKSATGSTKSIANDSNTLPPLIQTPLGLAILEIQGTLNIPPRPDNNDSHHIPIGRLVFPILNDDTTIDTTKEGPWMKKVYLYVGENQRLSGEIRKLGKVLAVLRRRRAPTTANGAGDDEENDDDVQGETEGLRADERQGLEIAELIRWKIVFGSRPEFV